MKLKRLLLIAAALFSAVSSAQESPRPERIYIDSSVLLGNPRVVSLGGAYTGVAEGAGGLPSNLAALAHKAPRLNRKWDVGLGVSLLDGFGLVSVLRGRDMDNDGRQDAALNSRQFLVSGLMQYGRFGLGAYFRSSHQRFGTMSAQKSHTGLAAAVALGDDDFIAAFGLYAANASFFPRVATGEPVEEWFYGDTGTSFDMLWRPHRRNYRIGLSVKPQVVGKWRPTQNQQANIRGQTIYGSVVSPASLSLGASWRFGKGARNYNRLAPIAYQTAVESLEEGDVPPHQIPPDAPDGRLLVTVQLDVIGPVDNAVNLLSFVNNEVPSTVGEFAYLVPRVGVEHETLVHRLRLRAGTYVEPSVFRGITPRPHLTGGFELFLFEYFDQWALSASFDLAPRYQNFGLSVGVWR